MFLKAAFKDSPFIVQLLMAIGIFCFGLSAASLLSVLLVRVKLDLSLNEAWLIMQDAQNLINYPDILRGTQLISEIGGFILPAILCAWLFSDRYKEYLQTDNSIHPSWIRWTIISAIVVVPFVNLSFYFNQQIPLPDVLQKMDESAEQMTAKMLYAENIWVFVSNVVIICILTAIGEEFLFRGVLQKIFAKAIKNPHVVIWLVAIIFSAIHLQFSGFISRMLLGAYLGYLLYYTQTIWIPILAHFTNNFVAVFTVYVFQDAPREWQEKVNTIGSDSTWWIGIASLALFAFCFSRIISQKPSR
jgi:membrane protease YdiL (CAAX protease family)